MNMSNNQWITTVFITAILMLGFLIFVFYNNKKAQMSGNPPSVEQQNSAETSTPTPTPTKPQ